MGEFTQVERYYCHKCDYITEDPVRLKRIRKLGGKCPACNNGEPAKWEHKTGSKYEL